MLGFSYELEPGEITGTTLPLDCAMSHSRHGTVRAMAHFIVTQSHYDIVSSGERFCADQFCGQYDESPAVSGPL